MIILKSENFALNCLVANNYDIPLYHLPFSKFSWLSTGYQTVLLNGQHQIDSYLVSVIEIVV